MILSFFHSFMIFYANVSKNFTELINRLQKLTTADDNNILELTLNEIQNLELLAEYQNINIDFFIKSTVEFDESADEIYSIVLTTTMQSSSRIFFVISKNTSKSLFYKKSHEITLSKFILVFDL